MTPQQFITKWQRANLSERGSAQEHFLDLCELLNVPKPAAADPDGTFYTFERGVHITGGGDGWADVWLKHHFGWPGLPGCSASSFKPCQRAASSASMRLRTSTAACSPTPT